MNIVQQIVKAAQEDIRIKNSNTDNGIDKFFSSLDLMSAI